MKQLASDHRIALLEFDTGWSMWLTAAQLPFHIGRHSSNDLQNASTGLSRKHCFFDMVDEQLHVADSGSLNGTMLHDRVIKNETVALTKRTCVLLSDMMFWITPCNQQGQIQKEQDDETRFETTSSENIHGICLVDICDSMEMNLEHVDTVMSMLRATITNNDHDKLRLLKSMGDSYLAVFETPYPIFSAAKRLLEWQKSGGNIFSADIRVTLDVGMTRRSYGHDLSGLAICRVARIDRTQKSDMVSPDDNIKYLKKHNRCLMTEYAVKALGTNLVKEDYVLIGKRKLKGFGDDLHTIYQYNL